MLDQLDQLLPMHRAVLVLRYVDDLSVPEVATAIHRNLTATNSLLARARAELRRVSGDTHRWLIPRPTEPTPIPSSQIASNGCCWSG